MKTNDIVLIDYLGYVDSNNKPVGHVSKILNEYRHLLEPFKVKYIVTEPYVKDYMSVIKTLKFRTQIEKKFSKLKLIYKNIIKIILIINLVLSTKQKKMWFINIDYSLFLALSLIPKFLIKPKEIYITIYKSNYRFNNKIADYVMRLSFKMGQKRIKSAIVTNKNIKMYCESIFMPDYFYNPDKYKSLQDNTKLNQVVCLGVMNSHKQLEELIQLFMGKDINLIVIGHFTDKNRFAKLNDIVLKSDNITLRDFQLSIEEYNNIFSSSKFVILPYDMDIYSNRTSGILIEAIFLNVIPIAPDELLNYNSISGIGYKKLSDLQLDQLNHIENQIIMENISLRNDYYSFDKIKLNLQEIFK